MPRAFNRSTSWNSASVSCLARLAVGSSMISTWASWASALAISVSCQYAVLRLPSTAPGSMSTSIALKTSAARLRASRSSISRPPPSGSRGEVDVLRDGEGGDQAELLEDHPDTGRPGPVDGGEVDRLAVDQNLALVGRVHPLKDLHQGRLAGAVAAGKGVYFTLGDFEADVAQHRGGVEGLVDAAHLDGQLGGASVYWSM